MKKPTVFIPARSAYSIFKQLCNLIPVHLVGTLAHEHGVDEKARTFSPWSHVAAHLFAQFTHALGLNDLCDALRMQSGQLHTIRGATPPTRNTFSHANQERTFLLAKDLYWAVMEHLMKASQSFAKGRVRHGYLRRFRHSIYALDSTTIELVANCMSWAKHRRRKAAAKCHLRLNLQSFLPQCAIIKSAQGHDSGQAHALCAGLQEGEIVVFDKAYVDFVHLHELHTRGIYWVSRAREDQRYRVIEQLHTTQDARILCDEIIELSVPKSQKAFPSRLRRVVALVEVDHKTVTMVFLTNNLEWSAWSVAELYRCRWDIEVFFKEIKQTLQLSDFLGHNANAIQWQIWTGLLVHLLLRYLAHLHRWAHSFTRIFTIVRAVLWRKWALANLLESYGTARPPGRLCGRPDQAYLPGFVANLWDSQVLAGAE